MKARFVVMVDWSGASGSGNIYGTWQTEADATAQAERWRRKVDKAFDHLETVPAIWVASVLPKGRSQFDAMLALCHRNEPPYRQIPAASGPESYIGNNKERQQVGDPGHCERCVSIGHAAAHPDLGCGDVGYYSAHGDAA